MGEDVSALRRLEARRATVSDSVYPLRACSETSLRHFIQAFFERLGYVATCNATRIGLFISAGLLELESIAVLYHMAHAIYYLYEDFISMGSYLNETTKSAGKLNLFKRLYDPSREIRPTLPTVNPRRPPCPSVCRDVHRRFF